MEYRGKILACVCVSHHCVFEVFFFFFLSVTFQLFGMQKQNGVSNRGLMGCAEQSPLLLCCISDSTAAIHCSCVSPLEYVLTSGCMCPVLLWFPPFFQCVRLYASPPNY